MNHLAQTLNLEGNLSTKTWNTVHFQSNSETALHIVFTLEVILHLFKTSPTILDLRLSH